MSFLELFIIAVGLSMDAFAVAISKGLSVRQIEAKQSLKVGLWFGGFQALMPIIGYLFGASFATVVQSLDHWIAFVLLGFIGAGMIRESRHTECERGSDDFSARAMFPLAIATSIDALAVGVSFAFLQSNITLAAALIGITTFTLSVAGVYIGNSFGCRYKSKAELFGGAVLVLMGVKILVEHLVE